MKRRHKQRGSLLVSALFLIIVVVAFVTVLSRILATSAHSNIVEYYGSLAFLTAQSGIEWKLNRLINTNTHGKYFVSGGSFETNGHVYRFEEYSQFGDVEYDELDSESDTLNSFTVYEIIKGDWKWPHGGGLQVSIAGLITVDDTDGNFDDTLDDSLNLDGVWNDDIDFRIDPYPNEDERANRQKDTAEQNVTASTFDAIKPGDIVDSRYKYLIKSSSDKHFQESIYFLATRGDCSGIPEKPEFTQTMPYMSDCSVEVSCDLIENIGDSNSTTSTLNIYRISSTATCDVGRFSTERTIYVDAKKL